MLTPVPQAELIRCRGPRAAEARLLAEIDRRRPRRADELAVPLRIVVPSSSLREHVAGRVADRFGSVAGVVVQTAFGVALEVLERAGRQPPHGDPAFELLVWRQVAREPLLATALAGFDDATAVVHGAVRDLLDAGFEPDVHAEAVLESLAAVGPTIAAERVERARAVVAVAAACGAGLAALETDRAAGALAAATAVLGAARHPLLPSRAVLVHGFADVTGLVADLLSVLLRGHEGVVILDRPSDPADSSRIDPGESFLDRLQVHFGGLRRSDDGTGAAPAEVELTPAAGVAAEIRGVADRIRRLLDEGLPPEAIGVVARRFGRHAPHLRDCFRGLGIPFSGAGTVVPGGWPRRRIERLLALVEDAAAADVDVLHEVTWPTLRREDVRLALRCLGAARIGDVATIPATAIPDDGVPLPVLEVDEDDPDGRGRAVRVPAAAVAVAVSNAACLMVLDGDWPARAPVAVHAEATRDLLGLFCWPEEAPESRAVAAAVAAVQAGLPAAMELDRGEWRRLLASALEGAVDDPIGGAGGGVQVLTVTEARGRTFDALFLVGLERGEFPRVVADDPVLPDAVRSRLAGDVLPFLPVGARSAAEERYLFAQLMASAARVWCSWTVVDGGRRSAPSPFVERLVTASDSRGLEPGEDDREPLCQPATAFEHVTAAAARCGPETLGPALAAALEEGGGISGVDLGVKPGALAASRLEIVAAAEAGPVAARDDPWRGMVGTVIADAAAGPWVTLLERTATCPWCAFVTDRLGVRPLPDPRAAVPDIDSLLVGNVVHRVLQRVVDEAFGERVESVGRAATREPLEVPWPGPERLRALTDAAADRVAAEAGLAATRLAPLLAAAAAPVLQVAREVCWDPDDRLAGVLGAELWGETELDEPSVRLRYRADRVDAGSDGLAVIDYKTGRPLSDATQEATRRRHLLARVAKGRALQAVAYALGCGGTGRYLYLRPDLGAAPVAARLASVAASDEDLVGAFRQAVAVILEARSHGAMFPRVEEADSAGTQPMHCRYCAVTEACRRDDSGFRQRLIAGMDHGDSAADAAARRLWRLGTEAAG